MCMCTHTRACIYVHIEMHTYACICSENIGTVWDCLSPLQLFTFPPSVPDGEKQNSAELEPCLKLKIARRNINNLIDADDTTFMAESEEELKSLLKVKEKSKKVGLKLNIRKTKIMASLPITSWQIDGKTVETVEDFILEYKITADGDCSHEIKMLTPWKESHGQPR